MAEVDTRFPNTDYIVYASYGALRLQVRATQISGSGLFEWPGRDIYLSLGERLTVTLSEDGFVSVHKYPTEGYIMPKGTWLPDMSDG